MPTENQRVAEVDRTRGRRAFRWVHLGGFLLLAAIACVQGFRVYDAVNREASTDARRDIGKTDRIMNGDWGLLSEPRALSQLVPAAVGRVTGLSGQTARTGTSLLYLVATAAMLGWVVRWETGSALAAVCAGSFMLVNDKFAKPNDYLLSDLLSAVLLWAAIVLLFPDVSRNRKRAGVAGGALIGLSVLAKESGLVMAPAALAVWLCWSAWRDGRALAQLVQRLLPVVLGFTLVVGPVVAGSVAAGRGAAGSIVHRGHDRFLPRAYVHLVTGKHLWRITDDDVARYEAQHGTLPKNLVLFNYWRWPVAFVKNKALMAASYAFSAARTTYLPLFVVLTLAFGLRRRTFQFHGLSFYLVGAALAMAAALGLVVVFYEPRYFFLCLVLLIPALWTALYDATQGRTLLGGRIPAFQLTAAGVLVLAFLDFAKNRLFGLNWEVRLADLFYH